MYTARIMEILSRLFGSAAKVRIMRLFLSNPHTSYDNVLVSQKANVPLDVSRSILNTLKTIKLVKSKVFVKETFKKKGGKKVVVKKKAKGLILNTNFPYYKSLYSLLIQGRPSDNKDILQRIKPAGVLKLVITAGVFIQNSDSRLDLLIVGDKLKMKSLDRAVRSLEAEIGKELEYAVFSTSEFVYRMNVYDKLVRDVVEYPHEKILDKIGL